MLGFSMQHLLLFTVVALLLFGGRGKISEIMGDFAKGIKSFKKGMSDDEETPGAAASAQVRTIENRQASPIESKDSQRVG